MRGEGRVNQRKVFGSRYTSTLRKWRIVLNEDAASPFQASASVYSAFLKCPRWGLSGRLVVRRGPIARILRSHLQTRQEASSGRWVPRATAGREDAALVEFSGEGRVNQSLHAVVFAHCSNQQASPTGDTIYRMLTEIDRDGFHWQECAGGEACIFLTSIEGQHTRGRRGV
jgi:hypothetical protein